MSKELTEQWRKGKLPCGAYYINYLGEMRVFLHKKERYKNTHEIYEILAPVPTYAEFKDLMSNLPYIDKCRELTEKVGELEWSIEELEQQNAFECECNKEYADTLEKNEQLEKQLKEANDLLSSVWDCRESREYHSELAENYFKKWG